MDLDGIQKKKIIRKIKNKVKKQINDLDRTCIGEKWCISKNKLMFKYINNQFFFKNDEVFVTKVKGRYIKWY